MLININSSWNEKLKQEFSKPYFLELINFINKEYENNVVYPKKELLFKAFKYSDFSQTKVVILGQDPYHNKDQAHGLSFSVPDGIKFPPSLNNIFKELYSDLEKDIPLSGNLINWAKQGVLLLNSVLTVIENKPTSHKNKGWENFTDSVIKIINRDLTNVVFLFWGTYAIKKNEFIDNSKHLVLTSVHPSPLSAYRGFFGNKHFSKTNEYLTLNNKGKINW